MKFIWELSTSLVYFSRAHIFRALDLCPVSKGTGSVVVSRPKVSRPSGIADGLFPDEPTNQVEVRHPDQPTFPEVVLLQKFFYS